MSDDGKHVTLEDFHDYALVGTADGAVTLYVDGSISQVMQPRPGPWMVAIRGLGEKTIVMQLLDDKGEP